MKIMSRLSNVNKIESASEVLGEDEIKKAYEDCGYLNSFSNSYTEIFENIEKRIEEDGEEKVSSEKNFKQFSDFFKREIKEGLSKAEEVRDNLKKAHTELLKKLKETESLINKEYYGRMNLVEDAFESFLDAKEQAEEIFKIKI